MSIYSGFATRNQQNYYDQLLYNIISTLLTRIAKFYRSEDIDENSFLRIISNQQKTLRKLQKRKYLQPKYAELLQYFMLTIGSDNFQSKQIRKTEMSRTLSVLDKQFQYLKQTGQKIMQAERGDASSLSKIQEKVKKGKKKTKSKKNSISIKSNLDIFQFKAQKRMPQLPSLTPPQHLLARTRTNSKINLSLINSRDHSEVSEDQPQQRSERKASLNKPPKFRAKMFYRQK